MIIPLLLIGLVACSPNGSSASSLTSSDKADSSIPVSLSIAPSSTSSDSTEEDPWLQYITGTPATRWGEYLKYADDETAAFYGELVKIETYQYSGTSNLYFMDGTYAYRMINYPTDSAAKLNLNSVYVGGGAQRVPETGANPSIDCSSTLSDYYLIEIKGGSSKIEAEALDLNVDQLTDSNQNALVKFSGASVTAVGSKNVTISVSGTNYTLKASGGTVDQNAVESLLSSCKVGTKLSGSAIAERGGSMKVISVGDLTVL